jgi:glycosyltransferase 2 family protein
MAHNPKAKQTEKKGWRRWVAPLIALTLVALAAFLLFRTLSQYRVEEITEALATISGRHFALMIACAAASYLSLTCFDWLALRYVGLKLAYPKVALASFCSLSLGHNIGFAALSSGAIRYRFYTRWGASAADIAKIIVFCGLTVGLGLMILGGLATLVRYDLASRVTGLPQGGCIALGIACLAAALGYLVLSAWWKRPFRVSRWTVEIPPLLLALAQVVVGPVNFAFVAACLYHALAAAGDVAYLEVAAVYVIANVTSLISHVPGGLGVIETVVRYLLPDAKVIGALVAFRAVYFLLPLMLGGPLFGLTELVLKRERAVNNRQAIKGSSTADPGPSKS